MGNETSEQRDERSDYTRCPEGCVLPPHPPFGEGDLVSIKGLQKDTTLNRKLGTIRKRNAGRWDVQLQGVGKSGFVKPQNLYLIRSNKFPKQLPDTKKCAGKFNLDCRGTGLVPVLSDTCSSSSDLGDETLTRRLAASPLRVEEEASPWVSFLAPLLLILMLVLFMYRKPVQHFFAENASPCCKGLRSTKQKAPVRHSV